MSLTRPNGNAPDEELSGVGPAGFAMIPRALLHDKTISQNAKWVYVALSSRVDAALQCRPSHARIADDSGLSVSTVQRGLVELRDRGLVTWVSEAGPNRGRMANTYTLGSPRRVGQIDTPPRSLLTDPPSVSLTDPLGPVDRAIEREPENEIKETSLRSAQPAEIDRPVETTQTLIAEWVDHCQARPPSRVIGQVAREVGAMLGESIPYAVVRTGLQQWQARGLHPSVLPSVVHEMRTAGNGELKSRRQLETDAQFNRMMERARERDRAAQAQPLREINS